jgi:hypothetical protein
LKRRSGLGARGSRIRASAASGVVIGEMNHQFIALGDLLQQIDIASDQVDLVTIPIRNPLRAGKDLQQAPRNLRLSLDRLVRVGRRPDRDLFTGTQIAQLLLEQPRRVLLHEDLSLEILGIA